MNEQEIERLFELDVEEMARFAVGTRVHLRTGWLMWAPYEPLCCTKLMRSEAPEARQLVELGGVWSWREPVGSMVQVARQYEITEVVPGHPVDCRPSGTGFEHAGYQLLCLDGEVYSPLVPVPAARLLRVADLPALSSVSSSSRC